MPEGVPGRRVGALEALIPRSWRPESVVGENRLTLCAGDKRDEVLGGFDKADYVTERLHATARDGVRVPVSIVYRKGLERDGDNPLLLYAYGSYGYSRDASFSAYRVSLLDRSDGRGCAPARRRRRSS